MYLIVYDDQGLRNPGAESGRRIISREGEFAAGSAGRETEVDKTARISSRMIPIGDNSSCGSEGSRMLGSTRGARGGASGGSGLGRGNRWLTNKNTQVRAERKRRKGLHSKACSIIHAVSTKI